jgi:Antibiotic biosynthesis monooxygenase
MYTVIREYRMTAGSVDDLMHRVDVGIADVFADQEGFLGYEVLDAGDGRIVSITTFTDRSRAQTSTELAADFVRDELGEFGIVRTAHMTGEVMVSRAGSRLLEPVHH